MPDMKDYPKARKRKCKICREWFKSYRTTQVVCSMRCAVEKVDQDAEKRRRQQIKRDKQKLKTPSDYIKEARREFNKFIRLRDKDDPCISCGKYHPGKYDAGHYRTTKAAPELQFEELNCHAQCVPCNKHLSGNIVEYRIRLCQKIGQDKVEWLEGEHEPKNYSIDDLIEIKQLYRRKWRELEKQREAA